MGASIDFPFDLKKAIEAATMLLSLAGGKMDLYIFVKCLYAAERESLRRFDRPMFGEASFAMKYGPVPAESTTW